MCKKTEYTGKGCISKYELKLDDNKPTAVTVNIQLDLTYEYEDKKKKNIWVEKTENPITAILLETNKEFAVDKSLVSYIANCIGNKYTFTIEGGGSDYKLTSIAYSKE